MGILKMDDNCKDCKVNKTSLSEQCEGGFYELNELSFYPPSDERLYTSVIEDIDGGDNFAEYVEYFWETYEDCLFD